MMIACPRCGIAYAVEAARFGARARIVQCSGCHYRWTQLPEGVAEPISGSPSSGDGPFVPAGRLETEPLPEADGEADSAGLAGADVKDAAPPATAAPVALPENAAENAAGGAAGAAAGPGTNGVAPADDAAAGNAAGAGAANEGGPEDPPAQPDAFLPPSASVAAPVAPAVAGGPPPLRLPHLAGGPVAVAVVSAAATVAVLAAVLILLRAPILTALPASAGFYGMFGLLPAVAGAGLQIRDVAARRLSDGGADVLVVSGTVASVAATPVAVPIVRATLYDDGGEPVRMADGAGEPASLAAGGTTSFEVRIADPPPAARRIGVGFIPRPDPPGD